jgi:transposase-like protein
MYKRNKYDYKFRLRCVEAVVKKGQSIIEVANANSFDKSNLRLWLLFYECKLPPKFGHPSLELIIDLLTINFTIMRKNLRKVRLYLRLRNRKAV